MIFDAQDMDRSLFDRIFDVCVIGSGPAGMTVALMLARQGFDVALMEGGAEDLTEESQALYEGEVEGLDNFELDVSRLRMLGGSSNHWNGRCRPLEAFDFFERPYNPMSGWPIGKTELDPYAAATEEVLDLTPALAPERPVAGGGGNFREVFWQRSAPTRFGTKYRDEIAALPNLALCLDANLLDLRLDDALASVTGAVFRSYAVGDPGFTVTARRYCLCLGGIENARALLNFDSQVPGGIGNRNDLVGRYFQDHVAVEVADVLFEHPFPTGSERTYTPGFDYQNRIEGLAMAFVVAPRYIDPDRSLPHQLVRAAECITPLTERLFEHLRHQTLKCSVNGLTELWTQRDPEHYPSGYVWAQTEQPLMADCRVMLNDERDAFGQRRATLDWLLDEHYYETLREATIALGATLADEGVGRIKIRNWLLGKNPVLPRRSEKVGDIAARHHMGTTRMAADPAKGVVDPDCRVHGIANLYVGGSSVFPTGGFANPTYTITQLSLRLADHLSEELSA
ncbi:GMC oxidoreductase [Amaricoccus solimangrovi]|uniref:GMC family oxidoreductase n=1 Tax=Amaricoccus solimangrovi TaxID=2589815 RepID=A0A501WHZ3_9RHOB|nr:GMC oxidoreductase [Amaricoccus solimangrovi]TPE48402.1 GMC family oxidoreductase [Amaricoccus solimangrovi]